MYIVHIHMSVGNYNAGILPLHLRQGLIQHPFCLCIHVSRKFIQQKYPWISIQCPCQPHKLPLSIGQPGPLGLSIKSTWNLPEL